MTTTPTKGPAPTSAGPDPHPLPDHIRALFTPIRLNILRRAAAGQRNPQIGEAIGMSTRSVKRNISIMLNALGCTNRAHLCVIAAKNGLLDTRGIHPASPSRTKRPSARQPAWAPIVAAARDGASLTQVGLRTGHTRAYAAARLSEAYRNLGVDRLPPETRREAAYQAAINAGHINAP